MSTRGLRGGIPFLLLIAILAASSLSCSETIKDVPAHVEGMLERVIGYLMDRVSLVRSGHGSTMLLGTRRLRQPRVPLVWP
jgi:hypothetical protein